MQTIAESNAVLEVCVTMMTTPSGGTLATNVDLTLTPISDTGKKLQLSFGSRTLNLEYQTFQLCLGKTF